MEWKKYGPGGFYPVHLGDVLNDRYAVFRRLGTGSQCLVWLARDKSAPKRRFVAVKVYKSSIATREIELDKLLPSPQGAHSGLQHLELTLDSFFVEGVQGRHFCRVVEPLGRTLGDVMQEAESRRSALNLEQDPDMTSFNPMRVLNGDPWTIGFAKRACYHILLGLDALHSHRIAHRDLHPGNVCVAFSYDLDAVSENEIQRNIWAEYSQPEEDSTSSDHINDANDERPGTDAEATDADSELDSDSSSDSEDFVAREERLQQEREIEEEKKDIAQQWRDFARDPGNHRAEPHSPEWNKANFLQSRPEIILRAQTARCPLPHPNEPRYLVAARPLEDGFDLHAPNSRLVLTDFGYASTFDHCHTHPRNGLGLLDFLPPEWLLGLPTGPQGDVFSLGLLFFEVVMLRRLVMTTYLRTDPYPERPQARSRLVHDLAQRLGPLPSEWLAHVKDADKLFDAQGKAREFVEVEGNEDYYAPGEWGPDCFEWGDIWHQAKYRKPLDMSDRDLESFVGLLKSMMRWHPEERPSTSELLQHEWFRDLKDR